MFILPLYSFGEEDIKQIMNKLSVMGVHICF